MNAWIRIPLRILALFGLFAVMLVAVLTGGYFYVEPSVPEAATLRELPPQVPLSIYTRDGLLMDVYGADRRDLVSRHVGTGRRDLHLRRRRRRQERQPQQRIESPDTHGDRPGDGGT